MMSHTHGLISHIEQSEEVVFKTLYFFFIVRLSVISLSISLRQICDYI